VRFDRRAAVLALLLSCALLGSGCAGTSRLLGRSGPPKPKTPAGATYLRQLSQEQAKLALAERRIPRQARTPAALAHSIDLIAGAIDRLRRGLDAIRPPKQVARLHARLVAVTSQYLGRLQDAARRAATPEGELGAADELSAATSTASSNFTATVGAITAKLAK
jgi:hypothetical protein